jgi:hypothetical protein
MVASFGRFAATKCDEVSFGGTIENFGDTGIGSCGSLESLVQSLEGELFANALEVTDGDADFAGDEFVGFLTVGVVFVSQK